MKSWLSVPGKDREGVLENEWLGGYEQQSGRRLTMPA